jgi:hypothetical protein
VRLLLLEAMTGSEEMTMPQRRAYVPVQIGVRLPPRLKIWLEQRADTEDLSVSTLVRQWIAEHAKRDLQRSEVAGDGGVSVGSNE